MREYLLNTSPAEASRMIARAWREARPRAEVREHAVAGYAEVVLDSFDGLLLTRGLLCRWRDGRVTVTDRDDRVLAAAVCDRPDRVLRAAELSSGHARAVLEPVLGKRVLLPLAQIEARAVRLDLLDDERKTVIRVSLLDAGASLPATLRLLPLRGYEAECVLLSSIVEDGLGLTAAPEPLADAAVRATGHPPGGVSAKVRVPLVLGEPAHVAAARVLLALLGIVEANLPGALEDLDTEFLHDLRVSIRRSRAVMRELKSVFPAQELARFRDEFRWLQQITGDARDLDVLVEDFDELASLVDDRLRTDLGALLEVLQVKRADAHEQMRQLLRSERATRLLVDWRRFLTDQPKDAEQPPIEAVAGARIRKVHTRMVRRGEAIGAHTPAEEYHELRKQGKELRYLLELFGTELFGEASMSPVVKRLKALQDVLGRHQDREVQQAKLRQLAPEVPSSGAVLAMGALSARLADEEQAARAEFATAFAAFAGPAERRAIRRALS